MGRSFQFPVVWTAAGSSLPYRLRLLLFAIMLLTTGNLFPLETLPGTGQLRYCYWRHLCRDKQATEIRIQLKF